MQRVQDAEQQIAQILGSVKGRGSSGMDQLQLVELNAAIELLEKDGGVQGGCMLCWQWPMASLHMCKEGGEGGEGGGQQEL